MPMLAVLLYALALGQDGAVPLSFDAAEVKASNTKGPLTGQVLPSGQYILRNITMRTMIASASGVLPYAVTGGPEWLDSDTFDVVAKAAPQTSTENMKKMLGNLLIERFELAVHREQKLFPAYDLKVGKNGPKISPSAPDSTDPAGCTRSHADLDAVRTCHKVTMGSLAAMLPGIAPHYIEMPVVNTTGLSGPFDFTLKWTPNNIVPSQGGMTIFQALEAELGLKLERRKDSIPIVVVDHVNRTPK